MEHNWERRCAETLARRRDAPSLVTTGIGGSTSVTKSLDRSVSFLNQPTALCQHSEHGNVGMGDYVKQASAKINHLQPVAEQRTLTMGGKLVELDAAASACVCAAACSSRCTACSAMYAPARPRPCVMRAVAAEGLGSRQKVPGHQTKVGTQEASMALGGKVV